MSNRIMSVAFAMISYSLLSEQVNCIITILVSSSYNEIGSLIEKDMGNATNALIKSADYGYNRRSWLTTFNVGARSLSLSDQFGMEYKNDDAPVMQCEFFMVCLVRHESIDRFLRQSKDKVYPEGR